MLIQSLIYLNYFHLGSYGVHGYDHIVFLSSKKSTYEEITQHVTPVAFCIVSPGMVAHTVTFSTGSLDSKLEDMTRTYIIPQKMCLSMA